MWRLSPWTAIAARVLPRGIGSVACYSKTVKGHSNPLYSPDNLLDIATGFHKRNVQAVYLDLPARFTIPVDDTEFPAHLRGVTVDMAQFRHRLKTQNISSSVVDQLNAMNFVWKPRQHRWNLNIMALKTFVSEYGHAVVPQNFVVPEDSPKWPKESWGLRLGLFVKSARATEDKLTATRIQQLEKLGFVWDVNSTWQLRVDAMAHFKTLHGHLRIPSTFEVPERKSWPQEMWNLKLGHIVKNARGRQNTIPSHRVEQLTQLGFEWKLK
ncbi:hypothetical protein H257_04470 [Aphanomyces astaci]|uniref:Helicase-associated domain-containing protein n=1 Tax=Aphanomyces astaci TaxID=112090 RepID=W4GX09_APHAT|nr:hypothetical protein H257_04470 [Aphanomyces astaci]ETV83871.1 hypothetical protein H257_04470 [Aphanomyces astaci]RQM26371.1 hypothetical protein B5M09_005700 [Aphanomyces astaci]|eukprot:XP_009827301.1 hypothetical protein H257_04470 [Aphanomyces astaci]